MTAAPDVKGLEVDLLVEGIYRTTGLDFRAYDPLSLRQRIRERLRAEGLRSVPRLLERVLRDRRCMNRLVYDLSVVSRKMFQDHGFYAALRTKIVPILRTYPSIRVWLPGCSTGEEVFSLAILFWEEGLYSRSRFYATDLSAWALSVAGRASFPRRLLAEIARRYRRAGGTGDFLRHGVVRGNRVRLQRRLLRRLYFAQHCPASDGPFNEFHLVVSRDWLSRFNGSLRLRVLALFHRSVVRLGYLALGAGESLLGTPLRDAYREVSLRHGLYRRMR